MDKWEGRVALVTGASAGIGAAITKALVESGMKVVGAARRVEKIESQKENLQDAKGSLEAVKCDLAKDEDVYRLFDEIKTKYGGVDVCVNNAGFSYEKSLIDGSTQEWRHMFEVNVIALCLCTKLSIQSMKERNIDDGHIININSDSGYKVCDIPDYHFYTGTKYAVTAITEGLRQEIRAMKSHIRISSISPGYVNTEFFQKQYSADEQKAKKVMEENPSLTPEDIANSLLHILGAPSHVEINEMLVRPRDQLF
ncbi:UNVERIFIED_CONTAM: hypothetical protein RMT77_016626 [Armadillidium vulgare]